MNTLLKMMLAAGLLVTMPLASQAQLQQQGQRQQQVQQNFIAADAAGFYTFDDFEQVFKKLKVEDFSKRQAIAGLIGEFNLKMFELNDKHAATLSDLEDNYNTQVSISAQTNDQSGLFDAIQRIRVTIPPIKQEVLALEAALSKAMQPVLSEKQYSKWLKYQKSQMPVQPALTRQF